jgi:serine/threonine protein kinase/CHASE2 domain-containing sensor protein
MSNSQPSPRPKPPAQADETATLTARNGTTPSSAHRTTRTTQLEMSQSKVRNFGRLGHGLMATWAMLAAIVTAANAPFSDLLERHTQTLFFELRGPVTPPANILILAMDADSLAQAEFYASDPQKYAYFAPIQTTPWQRTAYAQAIERLMQAGARAVSLDVVLETVSGYGPQDDQRLQSVLQKYRDRVILAALYEDEVTPNSSRTKLTLPNRVFNLSLHQVGFINYPIAANGRIHNLASRYPQLVAQTYPAAIGQDFLETSAQIASFAEATLRAAQIQYPSPLGHDIFFYGPTHTFPQIAFWQVLDPVEWQRLAQAGTFKDKIVLIGPTATIYQDFHAAPFSKSFFHPNPLAGIEIHANAVATLMENRAVTVAIPNPLLQGLLVLGLVLSASLLQNRFQRPLFRFLIAGSNIVVWFALSYAIFTYGRGILPTAAPIGAIALSSITYFATGSASEYLRKLQLRKTLEHYSASPIIQEIISQQDDLKDLLREREQAILGKQLVGRYTITKLLGAGGFGETYIAEDTQRPGNPQCVVKQLRPSSNNPKLLQLAQRLFIREAATLEKLGKHDRIPQLLAHFDEEGEFYLVQEYVPGRSLSRELPLGRHLPEARVITLVQELLEILEFVHSQGVIHRDIKPSNIIIRESDHKLVLIDFGAVKEIHQMADPDEKSILTVGIGTQGYMPSEQCAGNPRFSSDLYAVGMTAIQALIGLPPSQIKTDAHGEVAWKEKTLVSHPLAEVLTKMVRTNHKERYQSATEALQALPTRQLRYQDSDPLDNFPDPQQTSTDVPTLTDSATETSTQPWPETFGSATPPSTSAPDPTEPEAPA